MANSFAQDGIQKHFLQSPSSFAIVNVINNYPVPVQDTFSVGCLYVDRRSQGQPQTKYISQISSQWYCVEAVLYERKSSYYFLWIHFVFMEYEYTDCRKQKLQLINPTTLKGMVTFLMLFLSWLYFEGFQPEWHVSTLYDCRDIPCWSETLNFFVIVFVLQVTHSCM